MNQGFYCLCNAAIQQTNDLNLNKLDIEVVHLFQLDILIEIALVVMDEMNLYNNNNNNNNNNK